MNNPAVTLEDIRAIECPTCHSTAKWCKRPSGHSGPAVGFHAGRIDAANKKKGITT